MMTLTSAINKRRSIRNYQDKKIPRNLIKELLGLANLAPTAAGLENRNFVIIDDEKIKQKLFQSGCGQSHITAAAAVIAVVTNIEKFFTKKELEKKITGEWEMVMPKQFALNYQIWKRLYPIQDADTAGTTLMLAATESGLGSCWVGAFDYPAVEKILQLPKNWKVTCLITLGYSKDKPYPQKRTKIEKLIHWNRW